MVVGFDPRFVGRAAVAGFAHDLGGQIVFDQALAVGSGRRGIGAASNVVQGRGVAAHAVEILPVQPHVNVQGLVGLGQRRIDVTVFHPVAPATVKMTGAAIGARGTPDTLGHLVPVRRVVGFVVALKNGRLLDRIPRAGGKFFVGPGLFVADQAIHGRLVVEIETARRASRSRRGRTCSAVHSH